MGIITEENKISSYVNAVCLDSIKSTTFTNFSVICFKSKVLC